ncbi:hypothetical protein [Sporosarcina koreensis]|uniref:hypothetical protein n=1 Tax=Sporosarcina koreensis TaxID=334735 RepID=UPI00075A87F1|nr:hypothetical protein [Sporosarcina koreensis]
MIQKLFADELARYADSYVRSAVVTIEGKDVDYPIYKTIRDGNKLKKLVYLTSETGRITGAKLVDANGRELQTKTMDVAKGKDGFVIAFVIEVKIEGA